MKNQNKIGRQKFKIKFSYARIILMAGVYMNYLKFMPNNYVA